MWLLIFSLSLLSLLGSNFGFKIALQFVTPVHDACVGQINPNSEYTLLYAALACGSNLPRFSPIYRSIFESGLAHLFVVSGAHLILIDQWIKTLEKWRVLQGRWRWPILTLFAFASALNPPILRAWLEALLKSLNFYFELNWRKSLLVLLAGLLCLALNPVLWQSLSLQLSWLATLALVIAERANLQASAAAFLVLLPLTANLQNLHPVSIMVNGLAGAIFSLGLFPLLLLAAFIDPLQALADPIVKYFLLSLEFVPNNLVYRPIITGLTGSHIWILIFVTNFILLWTETPRTR